LVDDAVGRAADRRRLRQALGMPSDRRISNELIDELLSGASTEEEIAGPGGLLAELTKRLVERAMEVELTDHVGYEPHQEPPGGAGNTRNGTSPKMLITEHGQVAIDTRRATGMAASNRRSCASASGASKGSTTRSSPSTRGACRPGTLRRTFRRSTG
jgi:hypothetical protein